MNLVRGGIRTIRNLMRTSVECIPPVYTREAHERTLVHWNQLTPQWYTGEERMPRDFVVWRRNCMNVPTGIPITERAEHWCVQRRTPLPRHRHAVAILLVVPLLIALVVQANDPSGVYPPELGDPVLIGGQRTVYIIPKPREPEPVVEQTVEEPPAPTRPPERNPDLSHTFPLPQAPDLETLSLFSFNSLPRAAYYAAAAAFGSTTRYIRECANAGPMQGLCVGGYAARSGDASRCDTYRFPNGLYYMVPLCDCDVVRGAYDINSEFEACYAGYGAASKTESACEQLATTTDNANVPHYEGLPINTETMKRDACFYGTAIGKNNPDACADAGYFQDRCVANLAELQHNAALCARIHDEVGRMQCAATVAPLAGDADACMSITKPLKRSLADVSDDPSSQYRDRDLCLLEVVAAATSSSAQICDSITSREYHAQCMLRIAVRRMDPLLCTEEILGDLSYVSRCADAVREARTSLPQCDASATATPCTND